jgi:hypothetical protein
MHRPESLRVSPEAFRGPSYGPGPGLSTMRVPDVTPSRPRLPWKWIVFDAELRPPPAYVCRRELPLGRAR